jgi:uncharacterized repeat protein (TIGR04052 family)
MKKLVTFVAVLSLAGFGCSDSSGDGGSAGTGGAGGEGGAGSQDVEITVAAMVGEAEFVCGDTYDNLGADDSTLTLVDFRFYVQDVELQNAEDMWVPVALEDNQFQVDDIALLDFEDGCGEVGNAEMNDQIVGTVPEGEYDGLRFKMGLPPELNHRDASTAPGPLGLTALFWNWRGGYKFLRIDSGNIMDNPSVWRMHLGSTGCGDPEDPTTPPESSCTNPNRVDVELGTFDVDTNVVVADFEALVAGAPLSTNAEGTPAGCMSPPSDADCAPLFENLGLPFGEQPGGTQTFFSAE